MRSTRFLPQDLVTTVTYQHPLPEEMEPKYRQEDEERKIKFRKQMNRLARRRVPTSRLV